MKIKNIAAICKKNKTIVLFEKHSESGDTVIQYISDGGAAYPVTGLPPLDTESVLTIFDVPEKDRDKYIVRTMGIPEGINFEDTDADEKPIEGEALSIVYSGKVLKPLQTRRGLVFIESRYLSPVLDVLEEYRNGRSASEVYTGSGGKPEGIPIELADVIIRILDYCGYAGIDIEAAIRQKHEYNKSRPYRHGGKKC